MGILEKLKRKLEDAVDVLSKEVQKETGESQRRELVKKVYEVLEEFKSKAISAIHVLNSAITEFNQKIENLNRFRLDVVNNNINSLGTSLVKYGSLKERKLFVPEETMLTRPLPKKDFQYIENYIGSIDWSSEDVFWETFLLSPIGAKMKTQKQNLSIMERTNELRLLISQRLTEIQNQQLLTVLETSICDLYIDNVKFISNTIENTIVPELRLIDAFFEAMSIKDTIISDAPITNTERLISPVALKGTIYEKHYTFIKNAFMFYVIACVIYDTPVLTKLIKHTVKEDDLLQINSEANILNTQKKELLNSVIM